MRGLAAFTLLELLVVVTILGMIITLTAVLLGGGRRAGDEMLREGDILRAGRIVIDNLTEDICHAVADSNLTFVAADDRDATDCYGMGCSEINLVTWTSDAGSNRSTRAVQYWIEPAGGPSNSFRRLVRGCRPCAEYPVPDWQVDRPSDGSEKGIVAEYVAAFRIGVPDANGVMDIRYLSAENSNRLPAYVDIYLELLDENTARRAMEAPDQAAFVDRNSVRFAARVAPLNRFAEDGR
jgi:prepilin-type N-terminal cleavage/methylation domain-containing protein